MAATMYEMVSSMGSKSMNILTRSSRRKLVKPAPSQVSYRASKIEEDLVKQATTELMDLVRQMLS
jgi:hypothetical protein